jgi:hypothetical protein
MVPSRAVLVDCGFKPSRRLHSVKPRAARLIRGFLRALVVSGQPSRGEKRWRIGNSVYNGA